MGPRLDLVEVLVTDWMVYAAGVSLLLGAAAWGTEAALRALGRPARGVWLAALAGSLVLPAYAAAGGPLPALLPFPAPFAEPAASGVAAGGAGAAAAVTPSGAADGAGWFMPAWAAASLALACLILVLELRLRRERRGWLESAVAGVPVLVSRDVGPAVAGLVRGRIVLPAWALRLDARVVRAIVAHEAEHVRAHDTRALLAGVLAVCALPWNPVLWWQYRRLGLAVELDCDARVLRVLPDPRAYGLALLETARRRSRGALLHVALLRPRSLLRRRIEMMDLVTGRRLTARALACAGIAALALVVAVCADSPMTPEESETAAAEGPSSTVSPLAVPSPLRSSLEAVRRVETVNALNRLMAKLNETSPAELELMIPHARVRGTVSFDVKNVRLTPSTILEGELRYFAEPEPRWLLVSAVMRRVNPKGRGWTLRADTVWLVP